MSLQAFEKALQAAKTLKQVNEALVNYLNKKNISAFSFTYYAYSRKSHKRHRYDFASDNFKLWHQHYLSQSYESIDHTHKIVRTNTLPYFWDLQQQLKEAKSEREYQMRQDSIEYGIESGLCIPIYGPHERFANFLVAQMRGETCLTNWRTLQYDLFVMAHYYFQTIQPFIIQPELTDKQFKLSDRERQCLIFTAQGCSVAVIAERLHLSERTINYHLQRANKCLGTANKYQSIEKALEKGLIVL